MDTFYLTYLLVVFEAHGEKQFIVFATVEGAGHGTDAKLLCLYARLVVYGDALLIYRASAVALVAYMQQLRRQTVRHINHRCGLDARLLQFLDDIAACLGLQLSFQQVFLPLEVGLRLHLLVLAALLVKHCLLSLQQLQSHIGSTQVAAYAYQVGVLGS